MQTAMSSALVRVGLITKEQEIQATYLPHHLRPFQRQIEKISQLAGLMKSHGVKESGLDIVVYLAFVCALEGHEYANAYDLMLSHLKKRTAELGLA